ncbi:unnamed protein product [Linum tenue]|uniref:Agglutinin domain-containing protein n=1 Tax=Linum tenue TaxID=586396 RepID=A0AAV0IHZ9_9ROSI|nr:unnamed protein product [Linum tenue]
MEELPRFVVLYSETAGKYVRHRSDPTDSTGLEITADEVWSPFAKFEFEPSTVHPAMVHIRCCYNNKYLRRHDSSAANIVAAAEQPNDELYQWGSTLFQPEQLLPVMVRLLHVQLARYVTSVRAPEDEHYYFVAALGTDPLDPAARFDAVDWESLVTLPKRLTFMGDNGLYLGLPHLEEEAALRFVIDDDGDESIADEVVALSDGTVRIRNVSLGAYWRRNADAADYIWADDDLTTPDSNSLFRAIKVNDSTIALRNLGNNMVCKRFSASKGDNYLRASEPSSAQTVTQYAKLSLTDLVTSRRIEDIKFHLDSGWVHDENLKTILNPGEPAYNESDDTRTLTLKIPYVDTKTSCTWKATNSTLDLGPFDVVVRPDVIATVDDSSAIKLVPPTAPSYEWGGTTQGDDPDEVLVYEVTLPPWTAVEVELRASLVACCVPFSYSRYDEWEDGEEEVHFMEDGMYVGTNYYKFEFTETAPQPIANKK